MTIFSKIIAREIPADIVYEDEYVLAFLDIKPITPGHTLIIPKKPFENIFDAHEEAFRPLLAAAQKVAHALVASDLAEGVNLIMNNGAVAGQEVFHAHLHVVPRLKNDAALLPPKHTPITKEEMATVAEKISAKIKR